MMLTSSSFAHGEDIPSRYTCDGSDLSPPLSWSDLPDGTRSLALIVYDPDAPDPAAPTRVWVHWILYNLPPHAEGLPEGTRPPSLPAGTMEGTNDWNRTGYGGPCPPIGRHRYFHKLYALDTVFHHLKHPHKGALEEAMRGHVLAHAELIGLYARGGTRAHHGT